MCGIFGYFSKHSIDLDKAKKALQLQTHRGPDNTDYVSSNKYFIGHNRLSIIDLTTRGNQPMDSSCGNYIISFNGEIYNYLELRKSLIKKGYIFKSDTDTEVVLNGFVEYGTDFINNLDGIFAFIIYDRLQNSITIARDVFGVKPLYYYLDSEKLIIASEIKPFKIYTNSLNEKFKINFLAFGSVAEPNTIIDNVKMLPKSCFATIKNFSINVSKYYSNSFFDNNYNPTSVHNLLRNKLKESINSQLISDAPLAIFLSGGLDSSVLTYFASIKNKNINTVSITFDGELSEKKYQDIISNKYKTNHHSIKITERDFLDNYSTFLKYMDQPTIDGLNTFFVSKAAKQLGIKCAMSGIGSDEIFYGYPSFKNARLLNIFNTLNLNIISKFMGNKFKKMDMLNLNFPNNLYATTRAVFSIEEISHILGLENTKVVDILNEQFELEEMVNNNFPDTMANLEIDNYMKNQLLRDADVFGMANSVEIRVPFLSKDLVELVLGIDYKQKFSKNYNKKILVQSVIDKIPDEIFKKNKKGFELPYINWIKNNPDIINLSNEHRKLVDKNGTHWSKKWSLNILNSFIDNY